MKLARMLSVFLLAAVLVANVGRSLRCKYLSFVISSDDIRCEFINDQTVKVYLISIPPDSMSSAQLDRFYCTRAMVHSSLCIEPGDSSISTLSWGNGDHGFLIRGDSIFNITDTWIDSRFAAVKIGQIGGIFVGSHLAGYSRSYSRVRSNFSADLLWHAILVAALIFFVLVFTFMRRAGLLGSNARPWSSDCRLLRWAMMALFVGVIVVLSVDGWMMVHDWFAIEIIERFI